MADSATRPTTASVETFLASVPDPRRQEEARRLDALFRQVSGFEPQMWGPSIIGYGRYDYRYGSGHSGTAPATGFSPRKAELVVYVLPGFDGIAPLLQRLGPHRLGKSCLYLRRLDAVDPQALSDILRAGLDDLATRWTLHPS